MTSETDAEFVADMEWLHSHDRDAALPPEKLSRLFALARRGAAVQWRPIKEAVNSHCRVLLYVDPYGAGSGHWDNGWKAHFCLNKEAQPSHFMLLPPPPAGETNE